MAPGMWRRHILGTRNLYTNAYWRRFGVGQEIPQTNGNKNPPATKPAIGRLRTTYLRRRWRIRREAALAREAVPAVEAVLAREAGLAREAVPAVEAVLAREAGLA